MGQIVKRKKKGRPPKADPDVSDLTPAESDLRRSLRRRNVKYVFDLDDYFDEDELFSDDVEHRRREKKLKHLLKLQSSGETESTTVPRGERTLRVDHTPPDMSASSSDEEEEEKMPKKRKIKEYMDGDYNLDEENEDDIEQYDYYYEEDGEVRGRKPETNAEDSPPGTPLEAPYDGLPLPDKKALELILDKLQKKDIYGVYAEPVDPEELPDYHDVIEHPMDFATVRNKLRDGSYATFEQFESDVLLISSNAMQYNSPETIYYKQARSIQELAKKKFQKIRSNAERLEKEAYSCYPDQRTRSGSGLRKQIKRSMNRTVQEPVGSDFSSGATLRTAVDFQNVTNAAVQAVEPEKPGSIGGLLEGNSFFNDNRYNVDNVEETAPGKGPLSRFGQKSYVLDENCRATYNISLSQPVASTESIFSTFEGETKQLVPVGLYSDHSYARSLARFSATLGPVAWKVASNRIEQALPQGLQFGQGWVGEYEPLPTPALILENCAVKEPPFLQKVQPAADLGNPGKIPTVLVSSVEQPSAVHLLEKFPFLGSAESRHLVSIGTAQPARGTISEMRPSFFLTPRVRPGASPNLSFQHQNLPCSSFGESENKAVKQVELNAPPSLNTNATNSTANKQISRSSEVEVSKPQELSSKDIHYSQSGSFKYTESNGVAFRGSQDGKAIGSGVDGNTTATLSPNFVKPISYSPKVQGLSDPVQMMRMLAEKAQNQANPSNSSVGTTQILPSTPSSTNNNSNNAAAAAARAWMSVGSGGFRPLIENTYLTKNQIYGDSLSNSAHDLRPQVSRFRGEFPSGMHVQLDKNTSQVHAFVPQGPFMVSNGIPFQNHPQMVFPHQLANSDLSRFQLQSTWRNLSPQTLSRQKPDSLPPDLNIGFQSSGSPGRPSSGVLVDSPQQPDLALQL